MRCNWCGTTTPAGARACPRCGTQLQPPERTDRGPTAEAPGPELAPPGDAGGSPSPSGAYGPGGFELGGYGSGSYGSGGYGPGSYGSGGYGPGSYGPGSYGPGSYGSGGYGPGSSGPYGAPPASPYGWEPERGRATVRGNAVTIAVVVGVVLLLVLFAIIGNLGAKDDPFSSIGGPYPLPPGAFGGGGPTTSRPNQNTSGLPDLPHGIPIVEPEVVWTVTLPGQGQPDPSHAGDVEVVSLVDGSTVGIDLTKGAVRWTRPPPPDGRKPGPPRVVAADEHTMIWNSDHAVDLDTGLDRWNLSSDLSGPSATSGAHTISNNGRTIVDREPTTGSTRWEVPSGASSYGGGVDGITSGGLIEIVGDRVVLGGPGVVRALDVASGQEVWRTELDVDGRQGIVTDAAVVVHAKTGDTVAIEAATGALRWKLPPPAGGRVDDLELLGAQPDGQVIVHSALKHTFFALAPQTGADRWQADDLFHDHLDRAAVLGDRLVTYPDVRGRDGALVWSTDVTIPLAFVDFGFGTNVSAFDRAGDLYLAYVTRPLRPKGTVPTTVPPTASATSWQLVAFRLP